MKPKIMIATPTHDGKLPIPWIGAFVKMKAMLSDQVTIETMRGSWLPRLRSVLTARFLASDSNWLMCIDSDILWTPADVGRLLRHELPCVAGIYCRKAPGRRVPIRPLIDSSEELSEWRHDPRTGFTNSSARFFRADYAGAGFMLLQREALVEMEMKDRVDPDGERYKVGELEVQDLWRPERAMGEDVSFCRRFRRHTGNDIWVDTQVRVGHIGEHVYEPDMIPAFDAPSVIS